MKPPPLRPREVQILALLASADRGMLESGGLNAYLKARLRKPATA